MGEREVGLNLIGARPCVGKTDYAMRLAAEMIDSGNSRVLYFCPNERKSVFAARFAEYYSSKTLDNMIINDTPGMTWFDAADIISKTSGVNTVFIDSIDSFCNARYSKSLEMAFNKFSEMAKEKSITIYVLSELLRSADIREGYVPEPEDIRHFDNLKGYINNVYLLTRPEFYDESLPEEGVKLGKHLHIEHKE